LSTHLRLGLMHNRSSMVAVIGPVLWPTLVYVSTSWSS
jgi:hypothetical protein